MYSSKSQAIPLGRVLRGFLASLCLVGRTLRLVSLTRLLLVGLVVFSSAVYTYTRLDMPTPVHAATSSTVNFQARLLSSAGNTVPDGYYNIEFKLYGAETGGSALWTDTRYDQNGSTAGLDYRVRVVNGYLSVALGDTANGGTAFPSTINWDQEHWLTMNVGGATQTATPTYDGEMTPRLKLTAVPYSFAAGQLKKQTGGVSTTGTLDFANLTADRRYLLPDSTLATTASPATVCIFNAAITNCPVGSGSGNYIQNGVSLQTTANFNIQSGGAINVGGIIRGAASQTADLLQLQNSGGTILTAFQADGKLVFGPSGAQDTNLYRSAANTLGTTSNIAQTGATTFSTGTGTISLNGATTVAGANTFAVGTGATTLGGTLTVNGSQLTNQGASLNTALGLGDFVTGGVIGTAASTVDVRTTIAVAQTTSGQTLSLPSPTLGTAGRIIYILNTGTTSFTMHGVSITNGYGQIFVWNGTAWILGAAGGGSAITLQSAYDGGNTLTTSNARNLSVTLADNVTDGNLIVNIAAGSTGQLKVQNAGTDVLAIGSAGQLALGVQGSTGGLLIGGDTNLYRSAANVLTTDDVLTSSTYIYSDYGLATQTRIGSTGGGAGILFGLPGANDAALYQDAPNSLRTDDNFLIRTATNSTTAFQIQNATATPLFVADTVNSRIGIRIAAPETTIHMRTTTAATDNLLRIDAGNTAGDTGTAGIQLREINGVGAYLFGFNTGYNIGTNQFNIQSVEDGIATDIMTIERYTGDTKFKSKVNSTTAFQIQNAAGTSLLNVDTTNAQIEIATNTIVQLDGVTGNSQLKYVSGANATQLTNYNAGGGVQIQAQYFQFQNSFDYAANLTIDTNGAALFKNRLDSTTAFQIQNAAGVSLLTSDTTGGRITLYAPNATSSATTNTTWLRSPKNTVTAFFGDNDSTAAYTANEASANLRFNGAGVAWGDFGYYPNGGTNSQTALGNFRLSTTGTAINAVPDARLGVGSLYIANNTATQGIQFGGDTNLYRSAANILRTDDGFDAVGRLSSGNGTANQIHLTTGGQITFGSAEDTNLYRSAANTLQTDDNLVVAGKILQGGYLNPTGDNLLYNGDFESGNTNGWTAITSVVASGRAGNYTSQTTGSSQVLSDDYIPVDPVRDVLQLEGYFKKTVTGVTPGVLFFGYIAYDGNKAAITTAPCGTYCYFAAANTTIPADGAWHKYSATTNGEGTAYPNFPVGTKYVRVLGLINYGASADEVTQMDHVTLKRINNGALFVGNNFSTTNMLDQYQNSKLYTTSLSHLILEPASGNVGIGTTTPGAALHVSYAAANSSSTTPALIVDNPSGGTQTVISLRTNNTNRGQIRVDSSGNIILSGTGAGATYLGYDGGTGGVLFGNGASGTVGSITAAGVLNVQTSISVGGTGVITQGGNDVYANIRVLRSQSTLADGMYINYGGSGGSAKIYDGGTTNSVQVTAGGNLQFGQAGAGPIGIYDPAKTQAVFAMGAAYTLPIGGGTTTYGNFYGLGWSYNPDYGGAGNNPQSKAGLEHQLLVMNAGITQTALGNGIWTKGTLTVGNLGTPGAPTASATNNACGGGCLDGGANFSVVAVDAAGGMSVAGPSTYCGAIDGWCDISWAAVPGAASYRLYYDNTSYDNIAGTFTTVYATSGANLGSAPTVATAAQHRLAVSGTSQIGSALNVSGDVRINSTQASSVNALCHSGTDSDTTFSDRYIVACNPGTLTDFAEYYPTETDVDYGDLVIIGSESVVANAGDGYGNREEGRDFNISKLAKSRAPYSSTSIGVVSKNFGDFTALGQTVVGPEHKPMPIALNGRVPVKVTTENGAIQPGDLLTSSSTPGAAMKATGPGRVIGTALGAYDGTGTGMVFVFVNAHWYEPPISDAIQGSSGSFESLGVSGTANIASLNVSGPTTLSSLTVTGAATIQGTLTVTALEVGNITVKGHIVTAGDSPASEVLGAVGVGATLTLDGNDTAGTLTITTGTSGITPGDLAEITFNKPFGKTPKIVLSAQDEATDGAKIFPNTKTATGYILKTSQVLPPNITYTFDYFIVE